MSEQIGITIKAYDEASATVAAANEQISASLASVAEASNTVSVSYQEYNSAQELVESSSRELDTTQRQTSMSSKDMVLGFSNLATSAFSLYDSFDRVADMSLQVNRANLQVKTSANAVDDAEKKLTATIQKYGQGSEEAVAAAEDLIIAQERHTVAVERAEATQENMDMALVQSTLQVIPSAISMIGTISTITTSWTGVTGIMTGAQDALNKVMSANPIYLVIAAIGIIIGALVTLYMTCEPVKNAIDAIGKALYDFFKPAIDAVSGALTWFWNNVLKPLADFLGGGFFAAIKVVGDALGWLGGLIGGAFNAISNAYLVATGQWEQHLRDSMAAQLKAVQEGMDKQLEEVRSKYQQMVETENAAFDQAMKVALDFWTSFVDPPVDAWGKIEEKLNAKYNKQIDDVRKFGDEQLAEIEALYAEQLKTAQDSYQKEIDACNAYYDELIAVTQKKLDEIRIGRTKDLDHLELEYLRRKKLIESEVIDMSQSAETVAELTKSKEERLTALEDQYRKVRGEMTEGYRLKELEAEEANNANIESVNSQRAEDLKDIEARAAEEYKRISVEKGLSVIKAEQETNDMLASLNNERTNKIKEMHSQREQLETEHAANIDQMMKEQAAQELAIITAAGKEKLRIIQAYEAQIAAVQGRSTYTPSTFPYVGPPIPPVDFMGPRLPNAEGGVYESPTDVTVGEAGREYIIPARKLGGLAGSGGVSYNTFHISVGGEVSYRTRQLMERQLKNVLVKASSSGASAEHKKILLRKTVTNVP